MEELSGQDITEGDVNDILRDYQTATNEAVRGAAKVGAATGADEAAKATRPDLIGGKLLVRRHIAA